MALTGPASWPKTGQRSFHTMFDDMDDVFVAEAIAGTPAAEVYHASRYQRVMIPDYFADKTPPASHPSSIAASRRSSDCSWLQGSTCSSGCGSARLSSHSSSSDTNSSKSSRSSQHPRSLGKKLLKSINRGLQKISSIIGRSSSRSAFTGSGFDYTPPSQISSCCCSECGSDSNNNNSSVRSSIDNSCSSSEAAEIESGGQLSPRQQPSFSATLGRDWRIDYGRTAAEQAVKQLQAAEQAARRAERDAYIAAELSAWRRCDDLWLLPGWVGSRRQRACGCE